MNKSYSDATLLRLTKKELIEEIRIHEHNYNVLNESYYRIHRILMKNIDNINLESEGE